MERNELHKAAKDRDDLILRRSVAEGANLDVKGANNMTALSIASGNVDYDSAYLLVQPGANINIIQGPCGLRSNRNFFSGRSPLKSAAATGSISVVEELKLRGVDIDDISYSGRSTLQEAICNGHITTATLLFIKGASLTNKDDEDWTPVHEAAHQGQTEILKLLIEKAAELEGVTADTDFWNLTKLARATPLYLAAGNSEAACIVLLLAAGVNSGKGSWIGDEPIHITTWVGSVECVRLLPDAGVDIDELDENFQEMPLCKAILTRGKTDVIRILLERGANVEAKNFEGLTPPGESHAVGKQGVGGVGALP